MFQSLLILSVMAKAGSGVGLTRIILDCEKSGYFYSKYKMRQALKELMSIGAIKRTKNHYVMTLLGANLSVADDAAAVGYGVSFTENFDYMPAFQKELI